MLTLIEPPGAKREQEEYGNEEFLRANQALGLDKLHVGSFDKLHVGNSDSADYSDKWKREFAQRPTLCDADMTLQQIYRGKAAGNLGALYARCIIQRCLFWLGCFVQKHSLKVMAAILLLFSFSCYGLQFMKIETDIVKLWVAKGGRLEGELAYLSRMEEKYGKNNWTEVDDIHWLREQMDEKLANLAQEKPSEGGYQVIIQTAEDGEEDILTKKGLLRHVQLVSEIAGFSINVDGFNWTLRDICFKPGAIDSATLNPSVKGYASTLERLMPCVWITPADCFWDGGKALGPNPPLGYDDLSVATYALNTAYDLPLSWATFDPAQLVEVFGSVADIGTLQSSLERSGIGKGYIDRPCIDPYDPDCPPTAPNAFDYCTYFHKYEAFLSSAIRPFDLATDPNVPLEKGRCLLHRRSFMTLLRNKTAALEFMTEEELPKLPDYGAVMKGGCQGFARNILRWPQDMIIGGARANNGNESQIAADALQTVFLVASSEDLYNRFKDPTSRVFKHFKSMNGTDLEWDVKKAEEVILTWQRAFTKKIYNHPLNFLVNKNGSSGSTDKNTEHRIIHPLASTSMADMLEEFCQFNYMVIFVGYFLMLVYAVLSQMKRDGFCLLSINSSMGLGFAGVLTVTYASVSGLGLATWLGIEFNAATTQIVPFLTLGIGVDNMFMLLHNYHEVTSNVKKNEIGVLMKETGMSILMTSINNILSFLAGTVLPIPALRSFCAQSSILLTFNLIAIMTVYPAMIALDLRRRKQFKRDLCCWISSDENPDEDENAFTSSPTILKSHVYEKGTNGDTPSYHGLISVNGFDDDEENDVRPGTLHAFLRNYYIPFLKSRTTKVAVLVICSAMLLCGLLGIRKSTMGLELSDVLPEHTAPAAFLKARDKYFSFYPMHIVLRSEDLDIAKNQHLIESLRSEIGRSKYVVKLESGEASEKYWLEMFREWLHRLQGKMDAFKEIPSTKLSSNISAEVAKSEDVELKIAHSLLCSYGGHYNCTRVLSTRLIDASGTVNVDGFYNYLHAWYEYEAMLYAVSQADFYPTPRKLRQGTSDKYLFYVPPTKKIVYSQIPFYLSGLTDTPVIVEMIKEIREICGKYRALGVDSFPHGIAFTFWEQYLYLHRNLLSAISLIALAVVVVISVLLFNPWAACCILLILVLMTVELAGFLGHVGIKLNPVSAVTLITAVGIGVEFTAHVVFAFLTSLGDRNERMAAAIDRVFVPVIHGALSTLLGIIMLAFSEFEFVVKYFFVVMFALIIIGLINGLVLLPVLLSIAGPPCEVRPLEGNKKRLAVPPSIRERKTESAVVMKLTPAWFLRRILNSPHDAFKVIPKPDVWMKRERLAKFTAWQYASERDTVKGAYRKQNKIFHYLDMQRRDESKLEQHYAYERLGAALTEHEFEYKHFRNMLEKSHILLDNIVLSHLAIYEPKSFKSLVNLTKSMAIEDGRVVSADAGSSSVVVDGSLYEEPFAYGTRFPRGPAKNHTQKPSKLKGMDQEALIHFVGGALGGTAGTCITCPLEVVKTRLQSSRGGDWSTPSTSNVKNVSIISKSSGNIKKSTLKCGASSNHKAFSLLQNIRNGHSFPKDLLNVCARQDGYGFVQYRSFQISRQAFVEHMRKHSIFSQITNIIRKEGIGALYKGLGPNLIGVAPSKAVYFYVYSTSKRVWNESQHFVPNSAIVHLISAGSAGFVSASVINPIWLVKTRLQLHEGPVTITNCIRRIYQREGIKGFYKGVTGSYAGILETAIQFVLYEYLRQIMDDHFKLNSENGDKKPSNFLSCMVAGGIAKFIACAIAYPHEVIRTRLREENTKTRGFWATAFQIYREGRTSMYRGMGVQLMRTVPNTAITLGTYELVVFLLHQMKSD